MALIDSHCHLDTQYFPNGPDDVVARARAEGVGGFVIIGVGATLEPARHAIAISEAMPDRACAAVGVHPHDAVTLTDAIYTDLQSLAQSRHVVAVGEIGLDYHYDHSPRDTQRATFARLIALAREVKKPIVIHTRNAAEDTLALLESEGARDVGGIIHCFSEDIAFARRAIDLNFDISFSGILTFKSAVSIQETARWAPIDRILVETDSPYLAPIPFRGKPNEPAFLVHTARRLAELRGTTFEEVIKHTHLNTERRIGRTLGD